MRFSIRVLEVAVLCASIGCSSSHLSEDGAVPPGTDAGPVVLMDSGAPPTPIDAGVPPTPGDAGPPPLLDAGPPPPLDAGPPIMSDSGAPPSDAGPPGVMCGAMMCGAGEICCATFSGGAVMQTCTAADACTGATLTCDGPEDCGGGEVCCGVGGGGGGGSRGTECRAAADCTFRVCRADGDCPTGSECCPFMGSGVCSSFGCFGGP